MCCFPRVLLSSSEQGFVKLPLLSQPKKQGKLTTTFPRKTEKQKPDTFRVLYIYMSGLFTFLYSPNEYPFVSQHGFFSKLAFDHHSFSGGACWCCCSLLKWRMQGLLQLDLSSRFAFFFFFGF